MLRPGILLALSLTGTFVDTLLRTDFAIRRYPSYSDVLVAPSEVRLSLTRGTRACGRAAQKRADSFESALRSDYNKLCIQKGTLSLR